MWIYKPGESTNQGNGIKLFNQLPKIEEDIKNDLDRQDKNFKENTAFAPANNLDERFEEEEQLTPRL